VEAAAQKRGPLPLPPGGEPSERCALAEEMAMRPSVARNV
jgi:hypothetical protein